MARSSYFAVMPALPPVVMLAMLPAAMLGSPVPILFLLPLFPVPFHVPMGYPFVSGRQTMSIVLWQRSQPTGDSSRLHVTPLSVIVPGSVPVTFMGPPPVALIKENIRIDVRDHVNICSRYHDHVRRSSIPDRGEIVPYTYIYPFPPYIYIYPTIAYKYINPCLSLGCEPCQDQKQSGNNR
jgi:hypothetical protein